MSIEIEIRESENVFVLTPEGAIAEADFENCARTIDNYINEHDRIPSLVFSVSGFPHWKNFDAMQAHFHLVKNHHNIIPKVALVSDNKLLALARIFVDQFTGAKIRRFPEYALDDAINWAAMELDQPGSFEVIDGLPSDVIGIDARGLISATEYRETLMPLVEDKLKQHDKLKILVNAGPYFDGFSAGALWDDARFGLSHFTTFSKLALVTDHDWLRHSAKMFGILMPTEIMVFDDDELEDAKAWITS
ncbi:MAG: STAS/SEC14 domain-containing protein [Rhizobiaceae bacterium]